MRAYRGLAQVQPATGGGKAALCDDLDKGPQLVEIEAAHREATRSSQGIGYQNHSKTKFVCIHARPQNPFENQPVFGAGVVIRTIAADAIYACAQ